MAPQALSVRRVLLAPRALLALPVSPALQALLARPDLLAPPVHKGLPAPARARAAAIPAAALVLA